jgi:hypothetical protein
MMLLPKGQFVAPHLAVAFHYDRVLSYIFSPTNLQERLYSSAVKFIFVLLALFSQPPLKRPFNKFDNIQDFDLIASLFGSILEDRLHQGRH